MNDFIPKSLCILGRQPQLGLAELESLYGADRVKPLDGAAILDIPAQDINFNRLGGTIKTARILAQLPYCDWNRLSSYLRTNIPQHTQLLPHGKFTFGLSVYGLQLNVAQLIRSMLEIKKVIKKTGRPVRVVPNKTLALSSAQVLHNKLTHRGAWELIFIVDGSKTILAQTLFVQDIEAYAARDQARPARDTRVGMLPPKLAQIIINLSLPGNSRPKLENRESVKLLDPFCGTGVVLQEALLMGHSVIGTDIEQRMADYAKKNIRWLAQKYPEIPGQVSIEVADATLYQWPRFTVVASEVYLGRPLAKLPDDSAFRQIVSDTNTIIEKFLKNLGPQLKSGQRICLAVPAWRRPNGDLIALPLLDKITDMGYNTVKFKHVRSEDLVYFREDQIVARELLVLKKI